MLTAERYAALAAVLKIANVTLRTSPDRYRAAHELPGWHDVMRPVEILRTPGSVPTIVG